MNIHQRATKTYAGILPKTEIEAWKLAQEGYELTEDVGTLTREELLDIALYPLDEKTDFYSYRKLRGASREELSALAPALVGIYPQITPRDIFFYITRGWLPELYNLPEMISRWKDWIALGEVIQDLFLQIYDDFDGYIRKGKRSPLEAILWDYNFQVEILPLGEAAVQAAEALGMALPRTADPDVYLTETLAKYIRADKTQFSSALNNKVGLSEVVAFDEEEYGIFLRTYNLPKVPYDFRTDFVMQKFYSP